MCVSNFHFNFLFFKKMKMAAVLRNWRLVVPIEDVLLGCHAAACS